MERKALSSQLHSPCLHPLTASFRLPAFRMMGKAGLWFHIMIFLERDRNTWNRFKWCFSNNSQHCTWEIYTRKLNLKRLFQKCTQKLKIPNITLFLHKMRYLEECCCQWRLKKTLDQLTALYGQNVFFSFTEERNTYWLKKKQLQNLHLRSDCNLFYHKHKKVFWRSNTFLNNHINPRRLYSTVSILNIDLQYVSRPSICLSLTICFSSKF